MRRLALVLLSGSLGCASIFGIDDRSLETNEAAGASGSGGAGQGGSSLATGGAAGHVSTGGNGGAAGAQAGASAQGGAAGSAAGHAGNGGAGGAAGASGKGGGSSGAGQGGAPAAGQAGSAGHAAGVGGTGGAGTGGASTVMGTGGASTVMGTGGASAGTGGAGTGGMTTVGTGGTGTAGTGTAGMSDAGAGGISGDVCGNPDLTTGDVECDTCLSNQPECCSALSACLSDVDCTSCFEQNAPPSCATNTQFEAYETSCSQNGGACATACAGTHICGTTVSSPAGAACNECLGSDAGCCQAVTTCVSGSDATCEGCLDGSITTMTECMADANYTAVTQCVGVTCKAHCTMNGFCSSALSYQEASCNTCVSSQTGCCAAVSACEGNAACLPCISDPEAAACQSNPLFTNLGDSCSPMTATCEGSCAAENNTTSICTTGFSTGQSQCDACIGSISTCCAAATSCATDATCVACFENQGIGPGCGDEPFATLANCQTQMCAGTCEGD